MHEIYLPDAKPALEWVNNRVLQKVSPKRKHSLAQIEFGVAMRNWAVERKLGFVGSEWRFQIAPRGEIRRTLVPDLCFMSFARMPGDEMKITDVSRTAPDAAVEIISPGDKKRDLTEKIRVYLAAGTAVVFIVDPKAKVVTAADADGARSFCENDIVSHDALPGFRLKARSLFEIPGLE
jgi:Uma2 family endonuclease